MMMLRESSRPLPSQLFLGSRPNDNFGVVENHRADTKPGRGGLWTSDFRTRTGSAWAEYAAGEFSDNLAAKYRRARAWKLRPRADARIFIIDSESDLRWLQNQWPRDPNTEFAGGFTNPYTGDWYPSLAWTAIATIFDAVRLSAKGFRALKGRHGPVSDWSIPSTVWFSYCFTGNPLEIPHPIRD
jgi:hypothetical protein